MFDHKRPNIILLGADGTGKDTMCEALAEQIGTTPRRFPGGPIPKNLKESFGMAMKALVDCEGAYTGQVWNRFMYPDDLIYGEVIRGDEPEDTQYHRELFRKFCIPLLKQHRFHIVLLRITTEAAIERNVLTKPTVNATEGAEKYHNMQWWQWDKICQLYLKEVNDFIRYELPTRVYDTSAAYSPMRAQEIMQFATLSMNDPRWGTDALREHSSASSDPALRQVERGSLPDGPSSPASC